jgi:hypothetical protein
MADINSLIRVSDKDALEMIRKLADHDLRSIGSEVAWLVRQEWERRRLPAATALHGPETVGEDVERRR